MKKNGLKYPLIATVALVWGLIIYKVVNGLGNRETITPLTTSPKMVEYYQPADSFVLISDYPDPFIPKEDTAKEEELKQPEKNNVTVTEATVLASPKPVFDPTTAIQYS